MTGWDELQRARSLLVQKRFGEAESHLRAVLARSPNHSTAIHMLGLVRKDAGDIPGGVQLLLRSIQLEPNRAEFRSNLANLLLRIGHYDDALLHYSHALALEPTNSAARLGLIRGLNALQRYEAAETEARKLIAANDRDAQAWFTLGTVLKAGGKLQEAEAAYSRAIALQPAHAAAHHNLGALLSQMERAEEANAALQTARRLGLRGFELAFNTGRTLLQLYRIEEAERAFAEAVALQPQNVEAQINLARLRFMQGDPAFARALESAIAAQPANVVLRKVHADLLWRIGDHAGAEQVLRRLLADAPLPEVQGTLAAVLQEMGQLETAETLARAAVAARPQDRALIEGLICILLARGDAHGALEYIEPQRRAQSLAQNWIAYEAGAARLLGAESYRELYDYERFVQVFDLAPPSGWSSMEALNADLLEALRARHPFRNHPLDQSLRNGSQTARSLLAESAPAIRAVIELFRDAVEQYRARVGYDPAHPLMSRNRGPASIAGCWSVELRRDGFHINHIHPEGWISSAYYVSTPPEVEDAESKSGWLKFGEPRFAVPGATPEYFVQPTPGRLALFPSYMWHGTNPIRGEAKRTTIAFDVVATGD
jgi:tetratricopeptide (TPR) repeat protein